jgi:heat-inducible transcriptional repressor
MVGLNKRKQQILHAIVTDYILTAEPVGSRTISRRHDMDLSAATIRNEMADLEELGYLTQPHTSAGRVPSQKGYRLYVDYLMRQADLSAVEKDYIHQVFHELKKKREIDEIIQCTVKVLSQMTNYTSLILGPQFRCSTLKQLRLVTLDDHKALLVMITDTGFIKNRVLDLPQALSSEELSRIVSYLNEQLVGQVLSSLSSSHLKQLRLDLYTRLELLEQLLLMIEDTCQEGESSRIVLGGTTNILNQPEFRDVEKVKHLLSLFEQGERLTFLLETSYDGVSIRIGTENSLQEMNECSLVTATYMLSNKPVGAIGVLGPTRMEYAKVVTIIEHVAGMLDTIL